jgi:hypothetical protein
LGGEQDIAEDIPFLDLPGLFQQAVHVFLVQLIFLSL